MAIDRATLKVKIDNFITTNNIKDITAVKMRTILKDMVDSFDTSPLLATTLDLSDTSIYNVTTRNVTIPVANAIAGIFTLTAQLWLIGTNYPVGKVVSSGGGADGGVNGLSYKSITPINTGNLLSNLTYWELADAATGNVGNIEIISFGNPSSLPSTHTCEFDVSGINIKLIATPHLSVSIGELALDLNTDVLLTGLGFISFKNKNGISRKLAGGLLQ